MIHTEYYKDGTPCECDRMERIRFYGSEVLVSETPYVKGVRHGTQKGYYSSGGLSFTTQYISDVRHGIYREFHPSGRLSKKTHFIDGVRHGLEEFFGKSGDCVKRSICLGEHRIPSPVENIL